MNKKNISMILAFFILVSVIVFLKMNGSSLLISEQENLKIKNTKYQSISKEKTIKNNENFKNNLGKNYSKYMDVKFKQNQQATNSLEEKLLNHQKIKQFSSIYKKIIRSESDNDIYKSILDDEKFIFYTIDKFVNYELDKELSEDLKKERYLIIDFINEISSEIVKNKIVNLEKNETNSFNQGNDLHAELNYSEEFIRKYLVQLEHFILNKIPIGINNDLKRMIAGDKIEIFWILKSKKLINSEQLLSKIDPKERKLFKRRPIFY